MASPSSSSSHTTPSSTTTTATSSTSSSNKHSTVAAHHTKVSNSKMQIAAIQKAFRELLQDPQSLDEAAHYLYQSLLDDAVVGVFLEIHHLRKTGNLTALDGKPEDDPASSSNRIVDLPNYDIFGMSTAKKPMECICPNCDRPVAASRFAIHLQKCMGMGRNSSRIATRRLATKEGTSASSSSSSASNLQITASTDDEDDMEWASEKRRKKTSQNNRNNGAKKNNGK